MKGPLWTDAEDALLREHIEALTNPQLGEACRALSGHPRSRHAVAARLRSLGLRRSPQATRSHRQRQTVWAGTGPTEGLTRYRRAMLDALPAGLGLTRDRIAALWADLAPSRDTVEANIRHFIQTGALTRRGIGYVRLALLCIALTVPVQAQALLALSSDPFDSSAYNEAIQRPDAVPVIVGRLDTVRVAIDERTWREMYPEATAAHNIKDIAPRLPIGYHVSRHESMSVRDTAWVRGVITAGPGSAQWDLSPAVDSLEATIAALEQAINAVAAERDSLQDLLNNQPPPSQGIPEADSLRILSQGYRMGYDNGREAGRVEGIRQGEARGREAERREVDARLQAVLAGIRERILGE